MDGIDINPNLFFDARVIVGINEFIGNIQLYAFFHEKNKCLIVYKLNFMVMKKT